jgi:hypothetical protein
MATTVSFITSSPHTLTGIVTSDNGVALSVARATVLAACAEGPLKALLTRTPNWTVFNLGGAQYTDVHVRELINRGAGPQADLAEFFWEATGIKCNVSVSMFQQFEIRAQHSERF